MYNRIIWSTGSRVFKRFTSPSPVITVILFPWWNCSTYHCGHLMVHCWHILKDGCLLLFSSTFIVLFNHAPLKMITWDYNLWPMVSEGALHGLDIISGLLFILEMCATPSPPGFFLQGDSQIDLHSGYASLNINLASVQVSNCLYCKYHCD